MNLTKQSLGQSYVVAAGVVLSLALLGHAVVASEHGWLTAVLIVGGLVPALTLACAQYWLPASGIEGEQVWRVAEWSSLGIGILTLVNVSVLAFGRPLSDLGPVVLATSVAIGGIAGVLVGTMLELRNTNARLQRSNDVLNRVLRHNLRNDLTVVLGHLSELEANVSGQQADRVRRVERKVDEIVATTEKAREIDVALTAEHRTQHPLDVVSHVRERAEAVETAYPDATVETDLPESAWVYGDWLVGTVLDNVVENVIVHAEGDPYLRIDCERDGSGVTVRIADDCPRIPDHERPMFDHGVETPLNHSTGVGLWLVQSVMESYGGDVTLAASEAGGNRVDLTFPAAPSGDEERLSDRLRRSEH
ncbi:sensor histidine kinase [Halomicrobium katesii]|uniref:sensor histidine kinase n=1 Tax=Halomicrobium katesii TaxID=437163 RepID=UPI0003604581|nr:HAMP domain-containing sensor histidine kinase [Halomicrobium katesii]